MDTNGNYLVFISYSWDPENFDSKVEMIAKRLLNNGINVIFDKYDCKPGNNLYKFMEDSVNRPEVDHVLIMCTEAYKQKADSREHGVGAETLIISPQVYQNCMQSKMIPIILERDQQGRPCKPVYIASNLHFDFSDDAEFDSEFEKLIRFIYKKSLLEKPEVGQPPAFLENEEKGIVLSCNTRYQAFHKSLTNQKPDYLELFHAFRDSFLIDLKQFEVSRVMISDLNQNQLDELLLVKIKDTRELSRILEDIAVDFSYYWDYISSAEVIDFIECFASYMVSLDTAYKNELSDRDYRSDIVRFVLYVFILQLANAMILRKRFKELRSLIEHSYQVFVSIPNISKGEHTEIRFAKFSYYPFSLDNYVKQNKANHCIELQKLISDRSIKSKLVDIQETDCILLFTSYLRYNLQNVRNEQWVCRTTKGFPELKLLHLMSSKVRFEETSILFGVCDPKELQNHLEKYYYGFFAGRIEDEGLPYYEFATKQ